MGQRYWQLSQGPSSFKFPLPQGGFARRTFTFSNLEFVAASQMYAESDRMIFVRALAEYASNSSLVSLARLLYIDLGLDTQTLEVILDPYYSDAVFFGVECQDYGYPGSTSDERAELYLDAADPVEIGIETSDRAGKRQIGIASYHCRSCSHRCLELPWGVAPNRESAC